MAFALWEDVAEGSLDGLQKPPDHFTQEEVAALRLENEKLTSQIEARPPVETGQLQLNVVEDSTPTFLHQSHQSDSPSIDRQAVQALLSDIEECIAILKS